MTAATAKQVLVVGPGAAAYRVMFGRNGWQTAKAFESADLVCFTGGEDVDPALYGENPLPKTYFNTKRDEVDAQMFGLCANAGKPMVGICRGGQILNVLNGGSMWQHVGGHGRTHRLYDIETQKWYMVTSTHHQMMRPAESGHVIARAREAPFKYRDGEQWSRPLGSHHLDDIEVVYYEATKCLCFQPHPEYPGHAECTDYFFDVLQRTLGL